MATVTTTLSSKILFSSKAPRAAFTKDRLVPFAYFLSSRSCSGSVAGLSLQPDVLRRASPRIGVSGCVPSRARGVGVAMASSEAGSSAPRVQKSEEEWRAILNPEQFRILRQKGTEWAGTGKYNKFKEEGVYECAGCGTPLYKSTTKFDSGCGWPAFFEGLPGAIAQTVDADGRRIEITCTACGGHLGHVFKGEGFPTPTNERHCVNSVSLKFTPANN